MAKEKNEHNDRYMALKRLKRHGILYSQEKQELLTYTHIGCHCKYTSEALKKIPELIEIYGR